MRAAIVPVLLGVLMAPVFFAAAPVPVGEPLAVAVVAARAAAIPEAERAHLVRAREEQKLARDLYAALGDLYPEATVFDMAQRAEAQHMAYVGELLTAYEIPDPAGAKSPGSFANEEMQRLYDTALAEGRTSRLAALRASARIEELGLVDLTRALGETQTPEVDRVFEILARGTRHHLRSFVQAIAAEGGGAYAPQHLSREAFDAVMQGERPRPRVVTR